MVSRTTLDSTLRMVAIIWCSLDKYSELMISVYWLVVFSGFGIIVYQITRLLSYAVFYLQNDIPGRYEPGEES